MQSKSASLSYNFMLVHLSNCLTSPSSSTSASSSSSWSASYCHLNWMDETAAGVAVNLDFEWPAKWSSYDLHLVYNALLSLLCCTRHPLPNSINWYSYSIWNIPLPVQDYPEFWNRLRKFRLANRVWTRTLFWASERWKRKFSNNCTSVDPSIQAVSRSMAHCRQRRASSICNG